MTRIMGGALFAGAALAVAGCSNLPPITNEQRPAPTVTAGSPTNSPDQPKTTEEGSTFTKAPGAVTCTQMKRSLVKEAEARGNAGGAARFTSGKMVKAPGGWWFVAVSVTSDGTDGRARRTYERAFVTNAPSGGSNWVPLSDQTVKGFDPWDGVLPSGDRITEWKDYRQAALNCLR